MKRVFFAALLLIAPALTAHAQSVVETPRGVAVAHDDRIELFDRGGRTLWSVPGVAHAGAIAAGREQLAVLDPLANEAVVADLATGRTTVLRTGETPSAALFLGSDLFVLARDGRAVERFDRRGAKTNVATGADPEFLTSANGHLYVYARVDGVLQEIDPDRMRVTRTATVPRYAADLELDPRNAYLVDAHAAKMHIVDLQSMRMTGSVNVGAVPVDAAFATSGSALAARTVAIADPSAKRVWIVDGAESVTQAFARGFLRGLIGLGISRPKSSQFPTGVDRVSVRGAVWVAYDSSTGTLYRVTKSTSSVLARHVGPRAFAVTADGVVWWDDAVRRLQKSAY